MQAPQESESTKLRVDYVFTTFPTLSETFHQREVEALHAEGVELGLYSLWGGSARYNELEITVFHKWKLLILPLWIIYWLVARPRPMLRVLRRLLGSRPPALINLGENLLGLGFALTHARKLGQQTGILHAAWATAPGTAVQLVSALTGRPYSQGAHAYDVFRDGGDWWLKSKLREANWVVTSTQATADALIAKGAPADKLAIVRRGLSTFPVLRVPRSARNPVRILCVGRLIDKKGYHRQLEIYAALQAKGIAFDAKIIGDGPLRTTLLASRKQLGVTERVEFLGALPHDETERWYAWADIFIYTGEVAPNGDRDGLPNVIPEAMRAGLPVVSTAVAGVPEAIANGLSGRLIDKSDIEEWADIIQRLASDDALYLALRNAARQWVESEFDARKNAQKLKAAWESTLAASGHSKK